MLGLLALLASTPALAQARRFALFVGHDDGGEGTQPLHYARDDARRLHELFLRLGEVKPEDAMLLLAPTAEDVVIALGELERRVRDAGARGERTTLLFSYSGHALDGALRLGKTKLALEAIKTRLVESPADARIGLFDTSRTGPRGKAPRRVPALEVETRQAKGVVLISSSSPDEDSHESDVVASSYFAYFLATGLMGSADADGDGRITLGEAYAWTAARTTGAPPLTADLAENAALVLTDVKRGQEGLWFPADAPSGTWLVVDERGVVAAETVKEAGERFLALPPGSYTLKRRLPDRLRLAAVKVSPGRVSMVDEAAFRDAAPSEDPVKGTGVTSTFSRHWSVSLVGHYQAMFDRPTSAGGTFPSAPVIGAEVTLHNLFARGFALHLDGGYGWTSSTLAAPQLGSLAYDYELLTFGAGLSYSWFQDGRWIPFAGVRVAFASFNRAFTDAALGRQTFTSITPGVAAGLKVRLTKNLSVIARARVHYLLYDVDQTRHLGFADLGALIDYEFKE